MAEDISALLLKNRSQNPSKKKHVSLSIEVGGSIRGFGVTPDHTYPDKMVRSSNVHNAHNLD